MSFPLVDQDVVDSVAARLDLRDPNRLALESIAASVSQHYNVDGRQPPFEAVVDLATAVGKTFIIGATIEYYATQGVRDFAIITPGRTILRKTVRNFTAGDPKSLLPGMETAPTVITSDNFDTPAMRAVMDDPEAVKLYVFTVQALLKPESEVGRRTHRFQEGLGEAFYSHLQNCAQLLVFADEHHCYNSPAFSAAIRDLVPWVLIGLTATPDKRTDPESIIYAYPLAAAIADRLVKTPVLVGRKDDRKDAGTKLRDGIRLLEAKRRAVEKYCETSGEAPVRPMMLVVASSIDDADELSDMIRDEAFFDGAFRGAILNINSKSPEEALEKLEHVEDADSPVRIIVSVGMLKEGWDVKSVYVIASMRPSISEVLTEQTLGRGLRLPFGTYTGIQMLDTLEVLAHERYEELLKKAKAINTAFVDFRTWVELTHNADGQEVATIQKTHGDATVDGADGDEAAGAQVSPAATTGITSLEARERAAGSELVALDVQLAPRTDVSPLRIPRLTQTAVRSTFSLADITDLDSFKRLGERMAADPAEEFRRTVLSARIVEGKDGIRSTELVTSVGADRVPAEMSLLPLDAAVSDLTRLVLGASIVPSRPKERKALAPIVDALVAGMGMKAQTVLTVYMDRVASRAIELLTTEQRKYAQKPSMGVIVEVVDFAPVRLGRAATSKDRVSKFQRGVGYEGWVRSMYEQDWFDSSTERDVANIVDGDDEVGFWVRLNIGDCPILWNGMGQFYNPDFIVVDTSGGYWVVEAKMDKELQSADVAGKAEAARRWVNHVNADKKSGVGKWRYLLVGEGDVAKAKGAWSALKSLNRI